MTNDNSDKKNTEKVNLAVRKRLASVVKLVGSQKKASKVSGVSEVMLRRYIKTKSRLALDPIGRLCDEANISLDWLWSGLGQQQRKPGYDKSPIAGLEVRENDYEKLATALSEASSDYRPPAVLTALILELITVYEMRPEAAKRIIQTMELLEKNHSENGD